MTLSATRLTLRLHRFEVAIFGLLAALGVVLTIVVAAELDAVGYSSTCLESMRTGALAPPDCEFKANRFYGIVSSRGAIVAALTVLVPLAAAVLIGVAIVGREIERGTTRLAWALSPSRRRWLTQRVVPVLVFVVVIGLALGAAADRWLVASEPGTDPATAFAAFGSRGPVLAARAVFAFFLALAVGSVLGRALPALMVGALLTIVGLTGGSQVHARILASEAVVIEKPAPGDLWIDQRFRLPDGGLIGWEEMERIDPPPAEWTEETIWPTLPMVTIGVPGTRYTEVSLREIGALGGGSVLALLITGLVIHRRRPG
jgi:hypothetical protein